MKNLTTTTRGTRRAAFTLVELLLVVSIIAVLASLGVGVLAQAQNDAAISATRSRISLIEKILETELENYEVRRSPFSLSELRNASADLTELKDLKRRVIADLIRAEMPDGSAAMPRAFPTPLLTPLLTGTSLPSVDLASVRKWADATDWPQPGDGFLGAVKRSEMLYEILLNLEIDGTSAVEQIGSQAIGDSDGNGKLEIVDAWREPIFLQWQQEDLDSNEDPKLMVGLSEESTAVANGDYNKPVLPYQIRPFLTSRRLFEIDGYPVDYDTTRNFLN